MKNIKIDTMMATFYFVYVSALSMYQLESLLSAKNY